ncbi:MAG: archaemetzincin family Zn-dependent metalloprotease [Bacteroidota bacterium]
MNYIYLAPIGAVNGEILTALETPLWHAFGFEVRRMATLEEPSYAFDAQRNQYSSTMILRDLVRRCPEDAIRVLGVTENDLYIPMLSFIYGQAQLRGTVSIISLARLRQEFYTLPANGALLLGRVAKEALHEIGHTFGLIHCLDKGCPMSLATNIHQLDLKGINFCASCSILIRENITMISNQTPIRSRSEDKP